MARLVNVPGASFEAGVVDLGATVRIVFVVGDNEPVLRIEPGSDCHV
jgi:hypothetical protein